MSRGRYQRLRESQDLSERLQLQIQFLKQLPEEMAGFMVAHLEESVAQLHQDLFVLWETGRKQGGFFVEVGACNGLLYSNTLLLERKFGWQGLLVEPARKWHGELRKNRSCQISQSFVAGQGGQTVQFCETEQGEFSTALSLASLDRHAAQREAAVVYPVETISLTALLQKYSAPDRIDYLSLDTEGSELEILETFDFRRYDVRCITCEHNFTPKREGIYRLLARHGYSRKYENLSCFDDWYFRA